MTNDKNTYKPHLDIGFIEELIDSLSDKDLNHLSKKLSQEAENNKNLISEQDRKSLQLLKNIASMMLIPKNNNDPFQAEIQTSDGLRPAIPDDLSSDDLNYLAGLIGKIHHVSLKARIGDLLWLYSKPKDFKNAKAAIDYYISNGINPTTWLQTGKKEFERAYRLAKLLRDSERLETIERHLIVALNTDTKEFTDISYSIGELIGTIGALSKNTSDIAERLENLALRSMASKNYQHAIRLFEISSAHYKKASSDLAHINILVKIADCYALDAKTHFDSSNSTKLISNSMIATAIHAYRRIPKKHREQYSIDQKISELRHKLSEAGKNTLKEMRIVQTPINGTNDIITLSRKHVSGKLTEYESLIFFSGICGTPDYESLKKIEKENMSKYLFSSLFGSTQYSADGRVIAKTPAIGFDDNHESAEIIIFDKITRSFSNEIELKVKLCIIPALQQILTEHNISKSFIFDLCDFSPLTPKSNLHLIANSIYLGFEYEFSTAIHMICPQIENIVRNQLKQHGAHTTHIDKYDIEHENGLSTLLDMPEALIVFGQDKLFELKAVFAHSIGPNLRNEVAHGLLTDNAAYSPAPIYAWWVLLRMIIHSIITSPETTNTGDD